MKAAIVGCGNIASVHAQVLEQMAGCELAGFADCQKERAAAFASRFGGRAYGSLEEMMERERPEVLHVCTPHFLHVPMAVYGLARGAHIFMEKPPAISRRQLVQLEEASARSAGSLGFCFQNRYNPCVRAVRQLLESGRAGKILGARGFVTWKRDAGYYTESGWRGRLVSEGGGALINQSIHTLDLLVYFLGSPLWADAGMGNHHLKGVIEVEDTIEAYVRFADAAASFYATTAYCGDEPPLIEIACEKMRIRMEDPEAVCLYADGRREVLETERQTPLGKGYWGAGHGACIADFYRCLESGRRFSLDLEGVRDTVLLMLAVYESARGGGAVRTDGTKEGAWIGK